MSTHGKTVAPYDLQRHVKIKILVGYYGAFVAAAALLVAVAALLQNC